MHSSCGRVTTAAQAQYRSNLVERAPVMVSEVSVVSCLTVGLHVSVAGLHDIDHTLRARTVLFSAKSKRLGPHAIYILCVVHVVPKHVDHEVTQIRC